MWKLTIYLTSVLVILSVKHGVLSDTVEPDSRIVGGSHAKEGEFPYFVFIIHNGYFLCGGALITRKHVLTAAHCLVNEQMKFNFDLQIVAGTIVMHQGVLNSPSYLAIHKDFKYLNNKRPINDVGVITLKWPYEDDGYIKTIPITDELPHVGQACVGLGFGREGSGRGLSPVLKKYKTQLIGYTSCGLRLQQEMTPNEICAYTMRGVGTCHGDSGGPLVSNGKLIGIVSWGNGASCASGVPDVFTNVYNVVREIKTMMF